MIDIVKGYLQLANGLGELTRRRALRVARQLVQASPAAGMLPADKITQQVGALADDLVAAGRANRALLTDLVRSEVESVIERLGAGRAAELGAALAASQARIEQLERELAATRTSAKKSVAKKSVAKKSVAKKSVAKK